jgi:hypothetical protein
MVYVTVIARITQVHNTLRAKRVGWTRLCLNITVALVFVEMLALGWLTTLL